MKYPPNHPLFDVCLDLEVGDAVLIEGAQKTHRGIIIAVVRAEDDARKCLPAGFKAPRGGYGKPRDRRSFLVRRGTGKIAYWPRTSTIKPAV